MIAVSGLLPTPLFYCVRQYRCIWVEARQCLCVMCEEIVYIGILLRLGSNAITLETGSQVQSGSLPSCTRSGSVSSIADESLLCLHVTFLSPTLVSSSCVALPNFVWGWFVTPNELVKNSGSNYIKRFPCIPIMDTESRVAPLYLCLGREFRVTVHSVLLEPNLSPRHTECVCVCVCVCVCLCVYVCVSWRIGGGGYTQFLELNEICYYFTTSYFVITNLRKVLRVVVPLFGRHV